MIPLLRLTLAALLAASPSTAQDSLSSLQTFHVTAVDAAPADDLCGSQRSCSSGAYTVEGTKYTVKGYIASADSSSRTEYKLECVELHQTLPTPKQINYCERVHSGRDYKVSVLDHAIVIGGVHPASNAEPREAAYDIVSEHEVESGTHPE